MLKFLPLTALALGLSSGVALADHHGGEYRGDHRGAVEYRGHDHGRGFSPRLRNPQDRELRHPQSAGKRSCK